MASNLPPKALFPEKRQNLEDSCKGLIHRARLYLTWLSLFSEKSTVWGHLSKKKKSNSNLLTLQLLIAVMPIGQTRDWTKHLQEKFEEWDAHGEFWKVHAQYWKSRKPHASTELCICPRKTQAGPNLSTLADLKAQYKQELKIKVKLKTRKDLKVCSNTLSVRGCLAKG